MGLRSQTPAKKMKAFIRAVLFTIELKSAVSKKRFIMNFKLLMDRYKHVERSISNYPPPTHNPHNIKIPSLLYSSSEEGEELEEEEEVAIISASDQELRELIMASESSQSDVEVFGSSAVEGEGSSGSEDINYRSEEFIGLFYERLRKENSEEFDEISRWFKEQLKKESSSEEFDGISEC